MELCFLNQRIQMTAGLSLVALQSQIAAQNNHIPADSGIARSKNLVVTRFLYHPSGLNLRISDIPQPIAEYVD